MTRNKRKTYHSVSEMLNDTVGDDLPLSAAELDEFSAQRKMVKELTILRSAKGLSQEKLADKIGRSQSWVSKFENGTDDELNFGDVKAYMSALGLEFRPGAIKQGATLVDEIKLLAFGIRQRLLALAETVKEGDGMVEHVARFFADAFHNINRFLGEAAAKLPPAPNKRPYISIVTMCEEMRSVEEEEIQEADARSVRRLKHSKREPALN